MAAHTLDEDSPAYGNVSRAGDGCGVVVRVRSEDGTTTALLRRPGKEGPAPVPRGTGGLPPSPGLSSDGWTAAPSRLAGELVQSQPHAPRACTPPSQGEKILSARRAGQAGRRAGSGKTIPRLARDATRPSREAVRRAPPTHARLAATPRKTRGRPLTRLPSGPRDGGGESLRSRIEVRTRQVAEHGPPPSTPPRPSQPLPPSPSHCALLVPLSIYSVGGGTLRRDSSASRPAFLEYLRIPSAEYNT